VWSARTAAAVRGPGSLPARSVSCANCAADASVGRQSLPGDNAVVCGLLLILPERHLTGTTGLSNLLAFSWGSSPRYQSHRPRVRWYRRGYQGRRLCQEPPRSPLCVRPPPLYGLCCIFAAPLPISLLIASGLKGSGWPGPFWTLNKANQPVNRLVLDGNIDHR